MNALENLSDDELLALYKQRSNPVERALEAEGADEGLAGLVRSIYQQESGGGRNTKTSNAGAVGGMQILPGTFKEVADDGWSISDPLHNARAGVRYARQMLERAGGEPALAAAGYYGGPGGLEKARNGVAVRDPRNPNAPSTLEYGQQVAARMPVVDRGAPSGEFDLSGISDEQLRLMLLEAKIVEAKKSTKKPAQERGVVDDVARQVGLLARGTATGVAALPAMLSDAVTGTINAGLDKIQGDGKGFRFKPAMQSLNDALSMAGVPQPENATERVVQDVVGAMSGTGATVAAGTNLAKAASSVKAGVGKMLSAAPGAQVLSAATGSGAASGVREGGGGAGEQLAAGLAGAVGPAVLGYGAKEAIKRGVRGGEASRQKMADTVQTFDDAAGTTPTLGQATGSERLQALEAALGRFPGSAGVMAKKGQEQGGALADSVQKLVRDLAPKSSATDAGESIAEGIQQFKGGFRDIQGKLYQKLDEQISPDFRVNVDRTREALEKLNSDIAGAPELSKWFKNEKIAGIRGALELDADGLDAVMSRPGVAAKVQAIRDQMQAQAATATERNKELSLLGMKIFEKVPTQADIDTRVESFLKSQVDSSVTYEALKKLRTLVGGEIENGSLLSDVPRSKWKSLYAALSDDLGSAAKSAGPDAEKAWDHANRFTKKRLEQLEKLDKVAGKDTPEKVFAAALTGTAEGDTNLKRVINVLPYERRGEVVAAVLQKMGRALPGQQDDTGVLFSSERFLTNLVRMSPEARHTLFGRTNVDGLEKRIEQMAKMASIGRDGKLIMPNPSGTAGALAQIGVGSALGNGVSQAVAGNFGPLAAAVAAPTIGMLGAKAATSQTLVERLANKTVLPKALPASASMAPVQARVPQSSDPEGDYRRDGSFLIKGDPKQVMELVRSVGLEGIAMPSGVLIKPKDADLANVFFGRED